MASPPDSARELPLRNKLLYASGSLGGNVISRSKDLWLIYFYAPPEDADIPKLVPLGVVGALMFVARMIEALDDPLIGYWSDRTSSRWGRRIPFVVGATPFYAFFFFLLWAPPDDSTTLRNAVYFFVILETFHLFSTLSGGPFESLLPEIAVTSRDRVAVVAWQVAFGAIGAGIGLVASGLIVDAFGFVEMGFIMAATGLLSRYVALSGAWRHVKREVPPARMELLKAFRTTLSNDQFLLFLPTYILFNAGISMMTGMLPFYTTAVLQVEEEGAIVAALTATAIAVLMLALIPMYFISAKKGKAWVYSLAMLIAGLYLPWLFFMGFVPGIDPTLQTFFFAAFIGLPMAAVFTFPNAIMADIIDYDAIRTGMRREAMYYGSQATLEKAAAALYPPILAGLLVIGSTVENPLGIRLVGPVAGLLSLMAYSFFRGYRLPDTVTPETLELSGTEP
jgi:GPH family glycoside/pentoside/hexuronide:cation symporter